MAKDIDFGGIYSKMRVLTGQIGNQGATAPIRNYLHKNHEIVRLAQLVFRIVGLF